MNKQFIQHIGTLCLCLLLVIAGVKAFGDRTVSTSATIESKKLPIYCVKSDAPKVSISFDAAWGNVRLR